MHGCLARLKCADGERLKVSRVKPNAWLFWNTFLHAVRLVAAANNEDIGPAESRGQKSEVAGALSYQEPSGFSGTG